MNYGEYVGWLVCSMGFDSHGMRRLQDAFTMSDTLAYGYYKAQNSIYALPQFLIPTERQHPEWRSMAEEFIISTLAEL